MGLFVISGVSCAGKTFFLKQLDDLLVKGQHLKVMVSHTTRALRTPDEPFRESVPPSRFLEETYAQHIVYNEHHYGITAAQVEQALARNCTVLVDCTLEGLQQLQARYPTKGIFLYADPEALLQRHLERGTPPAERHWRLHSAARELKEAWESGSYALFLNNEDALTTLLRIVDFISGTPVSSDPVDPREFAARLQHLEKGINYHEA